jgi:Fic family protein
MEPYIPNKLPLVNIDYKKLITLVGEANAELAEYNGLLQGIINPSILLSPITNQEAVLSSKIEGTQATMEEVLEHEAGEIYDENKRQDIKEILNYRTALKIAEEHVEAYGINLNLILELHKILMDSVRGQNKTPGFFRKDQNWIGSYGCTVEEATFIPPSPLQLNDFLKEWEQYLKIDDFDVLAQSAIVHAQFELLHPFKDGNGRIGRLLIPLFLYSKKRLIRPMFYLSDYLEKNRSEYYARLKAISSKGDWTGWIVFYLNAVVQQARANNLRTKEIMKLYENTKTKIRDITHSQYSMQLLDAFFDKPIFVVNQLCERIKIPKATAHSLLRQLEKEGVIMTIKPGAGRRSAMLAFPELLNIAEGREVFRHLK